MISFENGKAKVNCNPLKPCERLVFISQPMRGLTEEQIKQRRQEAIEKIRYIIKEVYGIDDVGIIDSYLSSTPKSDNPSVWCLGRAIQLMADADLLFVCDGYKNARGCLIEVEVAKKYNIPIIYEEDC